MLVYVTRTSRKVNNIITWVALALVASLVATLCSAQCSSAPSDSVNGDSSGTSNDDTADTQWKVCSYNVGLFWNESSCEVGVTERIWVSAIAQSDWVWRPFVLASGQRLRGLRVKQDGQPVPDISTAAGPEGADVLEINASIVPNARDSQLEVFATVTNGIRNGTFEWTGGVLQSSRFGNVRTDGLFINVNNGSLGGDAVQVVVGTDTGSGTDDEQIFNKSRVNVRNLRDVVRVRIKVFSDVPCGVDEDRGSATSEPEGDSSNTDSGTSDGGSGSGNTGSDNTGSGTDVGAAGAEATGTEVDEEEDGRREVWWVILIVMGVGVAFLGVVAVARRRMRMGR